MAWSKRFSWLGVPRLILTVLALGLTASPAAAAPVGWAVGGSASIIHTNDGTNNAGWGTETSPIDRALNSVVFVNLSQGWAVGNAINNLGTIINTSNGGTTWVSQQGNMNAALSDALNGVDFVDTTNGWVVGDSGKIGHTSTGGTGANSWTQQTDIGNTTLNKVDFVDLNNGWVAGNNATILHTSNGGSTWSPQTVPGAIGSDNLFDVSFVDTNNGWIVGAMGDILRTSNGGTSWTQQTSGVTQNLNGVFFLDANKGWAVGNSGDGNFRILTTTNGGANWTIVPLNNITHNNQSAFILKAVDFVDAQNGWAVGDGGRILYTSNGGVNWTEQTRPATNDLNDISFPSSAVPEPHTAILMITGLLGLVAFRRWKK